MKKLYPNIFQPLEINGTVFKNRIFTAPATPHLIQNDEHWPSDAMTAYYVEKARGGSACVCVAGHNMDVFAPADPDHVALNIRDRLGHRWWKKLTDEVHFYDAKVSLELLAFEYHGISADGKRRILWSTDGVNVYQTSMEQPAIDKNAMETLASYYADAAEGALRCGFDSLLIHGGHGLFLSRMISPIFNRRRDEFGGSLENRAKFPILILDRIRERVGRDLLIEYRVSGSELAPQGGFEVEDCIDFLELLGDRIDIAHVSAGSMAIAGTEAVMHPSNFLKPGCNAYLARKVKESGRVKVPVLTLGAFREPALIEETIATGGADIVAMARATIADPKIPEKARCGREDEIIPCIKCFNCLDYGRQVDFACSVNPTVGRETRLAALTPLSPDKKRVAVVGGGPAGMQAAITAAQRGHEVTLFERDEVLGGKLTFSRYADFKYDLRAFMDYQIHMLEKLGVTLRTGKSAEPGELAEMGFDALIAALGADELIPAIPGVGGENVISACESYKRDFAPGTRICVIGGGDVGCETALYLAGKGAEVSLLEMQSYLAGEMAAIPRYALVERLRSSVNCLTGARCTGIDAEGVSFLTRFGAQSRAACDFVVLAAGMRARSAAAESFRDCAPVFRRAGDCLKPKNVRHATRSAFDAAMAI